MKHFIDIDDFKYLELRQILNKAKDIKKNHRKNRLLFNNKFLGLLFEKQSTRTRLSFVVGMQNLGGKIIELDPNQIGYGLRESKEDILKTISQFIDILMIRNDDHKQLIQLKSKNILPIINGLSNQSHPCQILSDIFTIEEYLGPINKNKVVWLGDYNNVLVSLIQAAEIFKFKLNILTPSLFKKKHKLIFKNKKLKYCKFYDNLSKGMIGVDCVMTDVWFSMGEKKSKKKNFLLQDFQVNNKVMSMAKKNSIFMHCLPAHRNEEVTSKVIDGSQSVVWQQSQNRMYVQQGIINYLIQNVKN